MRWMMKKVMPLLVMSAAVGCADASGGTDLPPDAEFGLETVGGATDNLLPEDGSAAAERILDFVNRPLRSDADVADFRSDLDAIIHSRAADGIVSARLGDDSTAGTRDDLQFDSLRQLDGVRFVGLATLGLLHQHVNARPRIDCGAAVGDPGGSVTIEGLDDLMNIERSGCTHVEGDLVFKVYHLPDVDRDLTRVQGIQTVEGDLVLHSVPADVFELRSLRSIGGTIVVPTVSSERFVLPALQSVGSIEFRGSGYGRLEMPSLTQVQTIDSGRSTGIVAPVLASVETLRLNCEGEHDFDGLETVTDFDYVSGADCATLALPALRDVGTLELTLLVDSDEDGRPELSAPNLEQVGSVDASDVWMDNVELGMTRVTGHISLSETRELDGVFSRLEQVGGDLSINGPTAPSTGVFRDFANLRSVGGRIELGFSQTDIREARLFERVEHLEGDLSIGGGCDEQGGDFTLFESATTAGEIMMQAEGCRILGFDRLEVADDIHWWSESEIETFHALGAVGKLSVDNTYPGVFPALEWAGQINVMDDGNVRGFDRLHTVENFVNFRGGFMELNGLGALRAVGGDIYIHGWTEDEPLQRLVGQLTFFGGSLVIN